ncbi:MAG: RNA polymerase sigma-70 factor [Salinivirgaceae bacterium]|nr:RNA polymerase sigma-70 factor [Salinivirgaceae bacterium]
MNPKGGYSMIIQANSNDNQLVERLCNDDKSAFTFIFTKYYKDLVVFSFSFTRNLQASEEIVQDRFLKLWEHRNGLVVQTSLKSYLLKSVQNQSLDWLRHLKVKTNFASVILEHPVLSENNTENYILHSELQDKLAEALAKFPEPYSQAFKMNRFDALNYQEIAKKLGVSVRTVEVRISKALLLLREELKDFLLLVVAFIALR